MNIINEHFNSKIIKNLFNNNISIKYTDYRIRTKTGSNIYQIFNTDNISFNTNNILDQFNFIKSNLYLQYTELLNKTAIKKIYKTHSLTTNNIIKYLKQYGIDKKIINNENIVLPIIKNINTYMKKLDICVNKIVTGNFTSDNTIDNEVFKKFVNVHDNDIEEIKYNKITQDLIYELYNKIKIPGNALIITKHNNYVIYSNDSDNEKMPYNKILGNKISVSNFNNTISSTLQSNLDLLKTEWDLCKENMEYINILNYKIPYYTQSGIKNLYVCLQKIFEDTINTETYYDLDEVYNNLEHYLNNTIIEHIYLIKYNNIPTNKHNNIVSYKQNHAIYNLKRNSIGSYSNILDIIINYINKIETNNDILNKELKKLLNSIENVKSGIHDQVVSTSYNSNYVTICFNFNDHLLYNKIINFFNITVYPKISLLYNEYKNIYPSKIDNYLKNIKQYNKACDIFCNRLGQLEP